MRYTINYGYLNLAIMSFIATILIIGGYAQQFINFQSVDSEMFTSFFTTLLFIITIICSFESKK